MRAYSPPARNVWPARRGPGGDGVELYAGCADLAGERDPASVGTYRAAVLGDVCAERVPALKGVRPSVR